MLEIDKSSVESNVTKKVAYFCVVQAISNDTYTTFIDRIFELVGAIFSFACHMSFLVEVVALI